jgi:hypothetical protein
MARPDEHAAKDISAHISRDDMSSRRTWHGVPRRTRREAHIRAHMARSQGGAVRLLAQRAVLSLDATWVPGARRGSAGRVERTARTPSFAACSSHADGHPRRPPPHRSGLADFPHPAPLVRASLCAGWSAPLEQMAGGTGRGSPCRRCSRSGSAGSAFADSSTRSASRSAGASRSSRSSR